MESSLTYSPIELLNMLKPVSMKPIIQTQTTECAAACLAMIANFHGHSFCINSIRQRFNPSANGVSANDIVEAARKIDLSVRPLKLELEEINQLRLPCILHWDENHFVVLKEIIGKRFIILDPGRGERILPLSKLKSSFTGVALEFDKAECFTAIKEAKKLRFGQLWNRLTGLKRNLTQLLILSMVLQVFAIASPFYMQLITDQVIVSGNLELLTVLALGFSAIVLFKVIVTAFRSYVVMLLSAQMTIQISSILFKHLIRLPYAWFERRHIGDIVSRFGSIDKIKQILTTGIIEAVVDGMMAVGSVVMMYIYVPMLANIAVASVLIYGFVRLAFYRPMRAINEEMIVAQANKSSNFMETVRAIQTVKLFGKENQRMSIWQNLFVDTINTGIANGKLGVLYTTINGLLFGIQNIVVMYLAATAVIDGSMSLGMLLAFIAYKTQFTSKASSLVDKYFELKMIELHLERVGDIALTPIDDSYTYSTHSTSSEQRTGCIEVKDLSVRYDEQQPCVIRNVSFAIERGQSVALVGKSGSGKTTLVKSLLGLLAPASGEVRIDGVDIYNSSSDTLRNHMATVMQNDQLLSGTIADNIHFFDSAPDMTKVRECAKLAMVNEDIERMTMGYNSLIGDMGSALSGGQKQRIILARALYTQPKFLVLDEATSSLDVSLEESINDNLKALKITRIFVSHRPQTVLKAQRILSMHNGQLNEISTDEYHKMTSI